MGDDLTRTLRRAFDSPPTVSELIAGLEALRAEGAGDALVRVNGHIDFHRDGVRVLAVNAVLPAPGAARDGDAQAKR